MLSPLLAHTFSGLIFRLLPDSQSAYIALEIRHAAERQVSFALIDSAQATVVYEGVGLEENWWASLSAFHAQTLYLQTFEGKEYPAPKSVMAIEAVEQAILWEHQGFYLERADEQGVWLAKIGAEPPAYHAAHPQTGQLQPPVSVPPPLPSAHAAWQAARYYAADSPYFPAFAQFIHRFHLQPDTALLYHEWKDCMALLCTAQQQLYFFLLDSSGRLQYQQTLGKIRTAFPAESMLQVGERLLLLSPTDTLYIF